MSRMSEPLSQITTSIPSNDLRPRYSPQINQRPILPLRQPHDSAQAGNSAGTRK
jgi:hypothetical protein